MYVCAQGMLKSSEPTQEKRFGLLAQIWEVVQAKNFSAQLVYKEASFI